MKKILFTMMILLGISAFSSNSYETDLVGRMKVLEEKVQTKLDSGVTADMREATTELSETWENELNTVYSLLMEKLPKAEKVKLENEQKKWLKNRNIKAKKNAKEAAAQPTQQVEKSTLGDLDVLQELKDKMEKEQ